jgi:transcriptional regulator with XRE-family HTH domain
MPQPFVSQIRIALVDYMQEHGLSRRDVAERLSVSPQYVSKILSGRVNFSFKSIAEIEDKLGIDCFRAAALDV